MITGFNTDIEHDGVVYHVQTEDKGLDTPIILSLVYVGGAILASKRAPYQDLIAEGFSDEVLSERLKRQHRLICAAIHSGRLNDLKKMGSKSADVQDAAVTAVTPEVEDLEAVPAGIEILPERAESAPPAIPTEITTPEVVTESVPDTLKEVEAAEEPEIPEAVEMAPEIELSREVQIEEQAITSKEFELAQSEPLEDIFEIEDVPSQIWSPPEKTEPLPPPEPEPDPEPEIVRIDTPVKVKAYTVHDSRSQSPVQDLKIEDGLSILLLDDAEFYSGEARTLRVLVVNRQGGDEKPLGSVAISIKILGTTFRPLLYSLKTDRDGVASVVTQIPLFTSGRAAVLVRAVAKDQAAELRRIIHPNR